MHGRDLAIRSLNMFGVTALSRRLLVRGGQFALNFHGVSSYRYQGVARELQPHQCLAEFRQVLDWVGKHFSFLMVDEFLHSERPGILLTFDDGHANNLTNILPLLSEYHAQGLFFISTQHVLQPRDWLSFTRHFARRGWGTETSVPEDFGRDCYDGLSEAQLAELAHSRWAVIGGHTVSHPSLPACTIEQVRRELSESRDYLQQVSGQVVNYFAYPYGDYNRWVAEEVRDVGYRAAFVVDSIPVGMPDYEIPRIDIYNSQPDYLSSKLSGLHRRALRGPVLVESSCF